MPERPGVPRLAPEPSYPEMRYVERILAFVLGPPWNVALWPLYGLVASLFIAKDMSVGIVAAAISFVITLLVPLRWGLSRSQFVVHLRWLVPGVLTGVLVSWVGGRAGVGWGLVTFAVAVISVLAGKQAGEHEERERASYRQHQMTAKKQTRQQPRTKKQRKAR